MANRSDHFAVPGDFSHQTIDGGIGAASATLERILFQAPESVGENGITITKITATFLSAVVGNNANRRNLNIRMRDGKGGAVAEIANLDFVTGTNATAYRKIDIFSGTQDMAAGEILTLQHEKVGTGLVIPSCIIEVVFFAK